VDKGAVAYRPWFFAAAGYNLAVFLAALIAPEALLNAFDLSGRIDVPFLQVLAMVIGVYGFAYWLLAEEPVRYAGVVWPGLLGKVLGVVGFLFYAFRGDLPWDFGWVVLFNDVIWLPAFVSFAVRYARRPLDG